ncbi:GntR family transcriptional regulator [Gorillibacterium sp. CAU 1737]|uniref:GntR family transcriptional regulator n=1 Tax=Gorillibacterium sp. CAU 1737 TaxID=3140362 RepID=UPI00325FF852
MNIVLSHTSGEPFYLQIVEQLRRQILTGVLLPGAGLPSIRQLAKDLQISVITTKRAYEELEKEGFIDSKVGRGSFVAGVSAEALREERVKRLEQDLLQLVEEARAIRISYPELRDMLRLYYEEDES